MSRPRIGLAAYWTQATWTYWSLPVALVPAGYIEGVRLAGGLPLVLPPTPEGAAEPGEVLDAIDGLLLIGGPDLGVDLYGSPEAHPETGEKQERRDAFELALLLEARRRRLPLLGICRGMQLLDVAAGGRSDPAPRRCDRPHAAPARGGRLRTARGGDRGRHAGGVPARRDGVGALGAPPGRRHGWGTGSSSRRARHDGQIEAVEDPEQPFCLGVLWHPEEDPEGAGAPLFRALVEAAGAYRDRE